jgi:hypothetical protein
MDKRASRRGWAWRGIFVANSLCATFHLDAASHPIRITDEAALHSAIIQHASIEFAGNAFITFTQPIDITASTTLDAQGHNIVLSGENVTRLFNVATGATLTLRGLTLANGRSTNAGAIWNDGTLVLTDCTFSNNIARGADGMNGVDGPLSEGQTHDGTPGQDARGGAIVNNGSLFATNSTFIANAAIGGRGGNGGGGRSASFESGGSGFTGGSASGGAVYSRGTIYVRSSRWQTNVAAAGNGGSGNVGGMTNFSATAFYQGTSGTNGGGGDASGGALVLLANFSASDCTFADNAAMGGDGADGATGPSGYRGGGAGVYGSVGGSAKGGALFAEHTGKLVTTSFRHNSAIGGDGGNGGAGGLGGTASRSGTGGNGGDGGNAAGGAIHSITPVSSETVAFHLNSVRGGKGGDGAGGRGSPAKAGNGGNGGQGGYGGSAQGGALVAAGAALSNNTFFANTAFAGDAGSGGGGGPPCFCRFSGGGNGAPGGQGGFTSGGAIYFPSGRVEIIASIFSANFSRSGRGGDGGVGPNGYFDYHINFGPYPGDGADGGDGGSAAGGAIASSAELSMSRTMFFSNRVEAAGGGSGGGGGSSQSTAGNAGGAGKASSAAGGAVWIESNLTSADCLFVGNSVAGGAGGNGGSGGGRVYSYFGNTQGVGWGGATGGSAFGGGLALISNRAEIIRTTFKENFANGGTGGNAGTSGTDTAAGPQGGAGGDARGGSIDAMAATMHMRDSTLSHNRTCGGAAGANAPNAGGRFGASWGLFGASGGAAAGGGISLLTSLAEIRGCTFEQNHCIGGTGGAGGARLRPALTTGIGGFGGFAVGGGLFMSAGILAMTNSTFFSNSLTGGIGGIGGANNGGAMGGDGGDAIGGAIHSVTGSVVLVNASFAENFSAAGLGGSGGVGETNTIGPMGASGGALGGTLANGSADFSIVNSLFKQHAASANAFGDFMDLGHNLSSDASFGFTQPSSFNGYDPLLGPLADNGGPTRTLALLRGSPAIDAGDDAACPPTDQRGVTRPFGAHCDIGAFEFNESVSGVLVGIASNSAPRIEFVGSREPGLLSVRIIGAANSDYWLESSTNLLHWIAAASVHSDTNGCVQLRNLMNTNEPMKFFRVRR